MIRSFNHNIAISKFETTATVVTTNRGVATVKQRAQLSEHVVIHDSEDGKYLAGDKVYVSGDMAKHQLALQVYSLEEGKDFILLPTSTVLVHRRD
jgi:hypothetical protein